MVQDSLSLGKTCFCSQTNPARLAPQGSVLVWEQGQVFIYTGAPQ